MSSRTIIVTDNGDKIHSSITVESIIIEYADGTSVNQTPLDFIRNNPLFDSLALGQKHTLRDEITKKLRYFRNKHNLNDD